MLYGLELVALLATDGGTTAAIVIAVFTLLGTLSANIVTWTKAKNDARNARTQLDQDRKRSNVEVAQNVMSETITILNERLHTESEAADVKLKAMQAAHHVEIESIKTQHKADISRLEKKIARLTEQYEQCKTQNLELIQELAKFHREE